MGGANGNTDFEAFKPAVTYNETNNEYLVVWRGDDTGNGLADDEFEIFGQRINAATGTEVGTNDFQISDMGGANGGPIAFEAHHPAVAYNDANNEYLVTWEGDDNVNGLVEGEQEIFGQRLTNCGDGVVDTGEECDEGADNSDTTPDACRTTCQDPACGDGLVDTGEGCDDGNTMSGDGCSSTCQAEAFGDSGGGCGLVPSDV